MSDNTEIMALAGELTADALVNWSDARRNDFVGTFESRVRVARYLLIKTAEIVKERALSRRFISAKHLKDLDLKAGSTSEFHDPSKNWNDPTLVGGRTLKELGDIAQSRADEIVKQLPTLAQAVRVISPEVSKMIDKRDNLLEKGKELLSKAEDLAGAIDMNDLDQSMSIAGFRSMVKDREKKRASLITQLDELGAEARALDTKINKFLYDGLPGLSEAVIKVINDYHEKSLGFSALSRRVGEQVKFGDSEAALEVLRTFEKDESVISVDIKSQFDLALEQLKLAGKKGLGAARLKKLKA